jgi:dUTP pyrophosphatase
MIKIKIQKCGNNVILPNYQTKNSAGLDLIVNNFKTIFYPTHVTDGGVAESQDNIPEIDSIELHPGCRVLIGTGLKMEIPKNYELQIRSRSGSSIKSGIIVLNAPGTIDADYRGEVGVIIYNTSCLPYKINIGDRIAQGIFNKFEIAEWSEEELSETERGDGGFGSTGK